MMCKTASKKFLAPIGKSKLPLPLVTTPPALDSQVFLRNSSSSSSCTHPGYFDILPSLNTPRFTPSALLFEGLDYSFPSLATPVPIFTCSSTSTAAAAVTLNSDSHLQAHLLDHSPIPGSPVAAPDHVAPDHCLSSTSVSSLDDDDQDTWPSASQSLDLDEIPEYHGSKIITRRMSAAAAAAQAASSPLTFTKPISIMRKPGGAAGSVTKVTAAGISKGKGVNSEDKKERNRLAAERYRQKGRDTISYLAQRTDDLERENKVLRGLLIRHGIPIQIEIEQ